VNLHSWSRAIIDHIQLVSLCNEKYVKYFGIDTFLERLIAELKSLHREGLFVRGRHFKVRLLVILGDNLGIHIIAGLTMNFSTTKYFCRYCEEPSQEWFRRWYPESGQLDSTEGEKVCEESEGEESEGEESEAEDSDGSEDSEDSTSRDSVKIGDEGQDE